MAEEQEMAQSKAPQPPYIAFQTLKTFMADLQEHGIPNRIDRSILSNFSGAVGSQLITSLKFLGLILDDHRPTNYLQALVEAHGTDAWPAEVAKLIRRAYSPLFRLNLEAATSAQFNEHFRSTYPGAEDVQRKSMTFFLNAVREAQIKVSPYVMKNKKPRSPGTKRRNSAPKAGQRGQRLPSNEGDEPPPAITPKSTSQVVFEAFNPSEMPPDVQQATLTLLTYLKSKGL